MLHCSKHFVAAGLALLLGACGSSGSGNAAPRLSTIPEQRVAGGAALSLDVAQYVSDREGSTLSYAVVSGGGGFTDSVYGHTFETLGSYTVQVRVTDGQGKSSDGAFTVKVTSANLAAVRVDNSGLKVLDTDTNAFLTVVGNTPTPSLATTLAKGQVVYQLAVGSGSQLWLYDTYTRRNGRIAETASGDVTWRTKTSDDRLLFTVGTGAGTELWFHNPTTGLTRQIAAASANPMVNSGDLVFHERTVGGQADIYYYDFSTDAVVAVATDARDERLLATLPNGGVVLSRVGAGGETDLFYFRVDTGLVEIGADQTALGSQHKTWLGHGGASEVVFSAQGGSSTDLWFWRPANGQSTQVTTGVTFAFDAVVARKVVYTVQVSGSEHDVFWFDMAAGAGGTVRDAGDVTTVLTTMSGGGLDWAVVQGSATPATVIAVPLAASPPPVSHAGGGAMEFGGKLANGDVVAARADGTALARFDVSAGAWTTIAGTDLAFAGAGAEAGDFLYTGTVASQTDLFLWDDSATTSVTVSDLAGADAFQAVTADGKVLFTHVYTGNSNQDLMIWNGTTATRLTEADETGTLRDHTVLGTFTGAQ